MLKPKPQSERSPERAAAILSKAVVSAANHLGLTQSVLADVLGVSESSVSRLYTSQYQFSQKRKREWEFALLFVRLFRSLDEILGHDSQAHTWLRGPNLALAGRPIDLIRTAQGLVSVVQYLDASRGRI